MKKRLFLSFLILTVVLAAGFSALAGMLSYQSFRNQLQSDLRKVATLVRIDRLDGADDQTIAYKYGIYGYITLVDERGKIIATFDESLKEEQNLLSREEVREALITREEGFSIRYNEAEKDFYIYAAYPILNEMMIVSTPLVSGNTLSDDFLGWAAGALAGGSLLALALAYAVYRFNRKPLKILEDFINKTYRHKSIPQVDIQTLPHELKRIVDIFKETSKELAAESANAEEQHRFLLNTINRMEDSFIAVDGNNVVRLINKSALKLFKIPEESLAYDNLLKATQDMDLYSALLDTREELTSQEIVIEDSTYRLRICPVEDDGGKLILLTDITELRKVDTMRKEFVSNVTHELKTPLTSIRGFIETLNNGALEDREAAVKFLGIIDIESRRLEQLIDELLALSDIEGSKVPRNLEDIQVGAVAEEIRENLQEFADRSKVRLENKVDDSAVYRGNRELFKAMLYNIASNAIKYNKEGGEVVIRSRMEPGRMVLTVADTGIGIAKEDQERIFERFYKVDKSRSLDPKNTGLGLAIVKHIVELFRGEIRLDSAPGKGSIFTITLPIKGE